MLPICAAMAVVAASGAASEVLDVRAFGARGDGEHFDTGAFRSALARLRQAGGGTLRVPPGRYLVAPLELSDHVTLQIEPGATLLGSPRPGDYPAVRSRWEGRDGPAHAALVWGRGVEGVTLRGGGRIDGQGAVWWERLRRGEQALPRPRLVEFIESRDLRIEDLELVDSPGWTLHPLYSDNVTIRGVTIRNPPDSPNTDGIDVDSSRNVRISDCHIDTGDDGIAIKSGRGAEGRRVGRAAENIVIRGCTLLRGHAGIAIGSETSGDVRGVVITDTVFEGTRWGLRFKSRRGRGGVVEDVVASDLVMRDVGRPLILDLFYGDDADAREPRPVDQGTPRFRAIRIQNVLIRGAERAAKLVGLPEMPLSDVTLSGLGIEARRGLELRHVQGLRLADVTLRLDRGPAVSVGPGEDLEIEALRVRRSPGDEAALVLTDTRRVVVTGLSAGAGTAPLIRVQGARSRDLTLPPRLPADRPPVAYEAGARADARDGR